ncbi:MAG: alpha/beta fold hydrolase, partial [Acidobacteriota bacterium]
ADFIVQLTLEYVRERFEFDQDRIILGGFSQGGFMAMALSLRYPDRFVGVISMAGPYVPETDSPPPADDGDPRYYFMVGSLDRLFKQVRRAANDFEEAGYETRLRVVPETPHDFPRAARMELGRALRFVLGD